MNTLDKSLRSKLENTITKAREVAEGAAKTALEQLGVEQSVPYPFLTEAQRELRRKLRAHGRQLGDIRDPKNETQEIGRLIEEVAYEHWHRMLFAKFLAENKLLMFYEDGDIENAVSVSLDECEEMAQELGYDNGWELASKLAAKMLPQIFRPESPVFELNFSPESQKELESLLVELPKEVFTASDSLGWVYQFWQTKKKKEVNDSGGKIGARELPAVTQLFTEPYMVSLLLDNSLGAWWVKHRLNTEDLKTISTEEELRRKCSLPGVPLEYLRFIKDDSSAWTPAGGNFDGWPHRLSELKTLDPCCGSGHFLVAAFLMLVPMRMELEGLTAKEACDAVLKENLHGLEIDKRCVEIAAFAVALTAWKYPDAGGFRTLPELQIAWCGQSVNVKKEEWLALANGDLDLRMHMEGLYKLFKGAPLLGSLINPRKYIEDGTLFAKDWEIVSNLLQTKFEKKKFDDGLGVVAKGMEVALYLLAQKYTWVITNVPYLTAGKQTAKLKEFCQAKYFHSRGDIATVFVDRINEFCEVNGVLSIVLPQNWLYQKNYTEFRKNLLLLNQWNLIAILGEGGFESSQASGAFVCTFISTAKTFSKFNIISVIDAVKEKGVEGKKEAVRRKKINLLSQQAQLNNLDSTFSTETTQGVVSFGGYADCYQGTSTGDNDRYLRIFPELILPSSLWEKLLNPPDGNQLFSGRRLYVLKNLFTNSDTLATVRGRQAWKQQGVAIGKMRKLPATIYNGHLFSNTAPVIIPKNKDHLTTIWCFCSSEEFNTAMREINPNVAIENGYVSKILWNYEKWQKIAEEKYPNGLPKPYSNDPTQWIFHGHPAHSEAPLQVAVARLLGYRWPAELDEEMELSEEARGLIKINEELLPYADEDGIVCIPPVRGETSAAQRLMNLLAVAYKGQDVNTKVSELLAANDHAGKNLNSWLREKFFTQHFKLFGHRPFIWHIWDGLPDGFAALVNYHKLNRKNLETLTYTYLGDWMNKQKADIASGIDGAQEKLAAAERLKKSLELIMQGEKPYDIFVRWKPIHQQPIGWDPDINDGVRLNIRPFLTVPDVGKKGAGILRDKPNISWNKDRGKDVKTSPWYHIFEGDRINDWHLSLEEKLKAKDEMR